MTDILREKPLTIFNSLVDNYSQSLINIPEIFPYKLYHIKLRLPKLQNSSYFCVVIVLEKIVFGVHRKNILCDRLLHQVMLASK